ncbi:MAG: RNA methyltransferase [Bacteroidales bacterium]|nr:RNA methyltransferase [Bacteroidales bacterium]
MILHEIENLDQEGVDIFGALTEKRLRTTHPDIFIAESPKVIIRALEAGLRPLSMLCERKHIEGDAAGIIALCPPDMALYTGERELLANLTGYTLTRGVLCAFRRREMPSAEDICRDARRVVIMDKVCDATNVGAIFRSAAALGMDAVLMTRGSCDPLNRRALRVSMGTVFQIPWTWIESPDEVKKYGMKTVALALRRESVMLEDNLLKSEPRLALILGTEGDGLSEDAITQADYTVKIPMHHGVDSLNVAAASAVACYALAIRK